jgi:hypothetical protein
VTPTTRTGLAGRITAVDQAVLDRTGLRLLHVGLITAVWLVIAFGRVVFHHFGTPFGNPFVPDGQFYTFMALDWSGLTDAEAAERVTAFYRPQYDGIGTTRFFVEQSHQIWLLVKPRVVYPLLSVPFVAAFGINGMLVVPWLASLFTLLVVAVLAARFTGRAAALAVVALLLAGRFLPWWFTANLTDTVVMGVTAAVLLLLLWNPQARWSWRRLALLAALVLIGCFVRQSGPVWVAAVGGGYLWALLRTRRLDNTWLAPAAVTTVVAAAATVFIMRWAPFPLSAQMTTASGHSTFGDAVLNYPGTYWRVLSTEFFVAPLREDPGLFLLVVLAVVGAIAGRRSPWAVVLLTMVAGTVAVAALNGSVTNFRYLLPVVPVLAIAAAAGMHRIATVGRRAPT